jgi:hypothetical protein
MNAFFQIGFLPNPKIQELRDQMVWWAMNNKHSFKKNFFPKRKLHRNLKSHGHQLKPFNLKWILPG